ncbi:hypothetical protein [Caedibacter taeniospiralis]|uniref:Uncharacterized protein n=1 Tax=Caedibacter taeniospiralis TaxID=28907 RepID=Q6TFD2_CAETA|nr:hypothetical protein [Caedibacter taeniospiralis]AAR87127.1 hypothetical protein [Caedibacter taeniospiralis]
MRKLLIGLLAIIALQNAFGGQCQYGIPPEPNLKIINLAQNIRVVETIKNRYEQMNDYEKNSFIEACYASFNNPINNYSSIVNVGRSHLFEVHSNKEDKIIVGCFPNGMVNKW